MSGTPIQLMYKNSANWKGSEILPAGVIGLEVDTKKYKRGDGSTTWEKLAYFFSNEINNAVNALTGRVNH